MNPIAMFLIAVAIGFCVVGYGIVAAQFTIESFRAFRDGDITRCLGLAFGASGFWLAAGFLTGVAQYLFKNHFLTT